MRLGPKQLDWLAHHAGVFRAVVVPDRLLESLRAKGCLVSHGTETDGFLVLTPAGYRAVADALDSGAIVRPPLAEWGKGKAAKLAGTEGAA